VLRKYETIIVIDSLLKAEETENIVSKYERFISANGGQIEAIEHWGKKRLAYEIKKRQYGFYVLIRFNGPPTMIKQLEREYRLNESLLRYATIKLDDRALRALERQKDLGYLSKPGAIETKADPLAGVEPDSGSAELVEELIPSTSDAQIGETEVVAKLDAAPIAGSGKAATEET